MAYDKEVNGIRFGYRQDMTEKLVFMINGLYEYADYSMIDGSSRTDDRYYIAPGFQYYLVDWLMLELDYTWDKRTSDYADFEYTTNTFLGSLNFSL